jgi:hypothetical protein
MVVMVSKRLAEELDALIKEAQQYCKMPLHAPVVKGQEQLEGTRRYVIDSLVDNFHRDLESFKSSDEYINDEELYERIDRLAEYKELSKKWTR